jgi:hypothetical protein
MMATVEARPMKINWKRVVFAAIWSELLFYALWVTNALTARYTGPSRLFLIAAIFEILIPFFLGGLWVARKIESRFILHGVLVGILANILLAIVVALILLSQHASPRDLNIFFGFLLMAMKIIGAVAGSYVGGKRTKLEIQPSRHTLTNDGGSTSEN